MNLATVAKDCIFFCGTISGFNQYVISYHCAKFHAFNIKCPILTPGISTNNTVFVREKSNYRRLSYKPCPARSPFIIFFHLMIRLEMRRALNGGVYESPMYIAQLPHVEIFCCVKKLKKAHDGNLP